MTISFTDRRCTVDIHQTAKGYSFVYGNKTHLKPNEEAVHHFFLKEYQANKLDTVKLRYPDTNYYLHFTLDEPEKLTKRQLRAILALECNGAWCEEKNGKQRYFVREGWFFPKIKELTHEEFAAYQPTSTAQKAMKLALGALSLTPVISSHARQASGIGALLFSLINAGPALAQMPAIGEFRINTNTTGLQTQPAVAALNEGGFVAAWFGYQTGDGDIYGQKYDATGIPVSSEFRINTNTTNNQVGPTVAALKDGGFVAVWHGLQTGDYDIYGQRYDAAGIPIGSEFRINTNTINDQFDPTLAALNNGGFVVAWHGLQTGDLDIYGQIYNATGIPGGSEFRINTNTTHGQGGPALAALKDGGFVVAWIGDQTGDSDIYGQRYDATGIPVGSEFRINTNTTSEQYSPTLAALKDGGFVVAWNGGPIGDYDIYGQMYNATGIPVSSEFRINTNTTNSQVSPNIAALNDGGFVVAWYGYQTGGLDIYGQRYDSTGIPIGSEFRINTNTAGTQNYPAVAALNDGGFVVAWQGDQTGDYDIYGQRYDANGMPVLSYSSLSSSLGINSATTTSAATSIANPSSSSVSISQIMSSSIQTFQTTSGFTSTPATPSPSPLPTSTSQAGSSSTRIGSSQSSIISSPGSSQSPLLLSITEVTYGTDYSINLNGVNVGTFTITGGTGLYDGTQSNTLILQLDPDADLVGQTITLFALPSDEEGNFQTIELQGVSCVAYDTQIVQDGGSRFFQATIQATTCSTGNKPAVSLLPTMLRI